MRHVSKVALGAAVLAMLGTGSASAFPSGTATSLHGRIVAASGGGIGGASIVLTATDGSTYRETSNPGGEYFFLSIPAGSYQIAISAAAFQSYPNQDYDNANSDGQQLPPGPPVKEDFVLHPPAPI